MVETRESVLNDLNFNQDFTGSSGVQNHKKILLAQADELLKFVVICFEGGLIQINNLYTGALIYNHYEPRDKLLSKGHSKSEVEPLKLDHEVAALCFLKLQTKYWIAASCYDGRVAFLTIPQVSQGRSFLRYKQCKSSHSRDVLTLDINSDNIVATASTDNVICFWNSFSGVESKKIVPPENIVASYKGQKIVFIKFLFPNKKDLLLVVLNTGSCYIFETQSEKFLVFPNEEESSQSPTPNKDLQR